MDFWGLTEMFYPVKSLRCINIQWNRKYYEAGDYSIQLRSSDWDNSIAYISTKDRPETGMVQKIETEHTVKGDFVNVSGFFLEGMLNWAVIHPRYVWTANLVEMCRDMVYRYLQGKVGLVNIVIPANTLGDNTTITYENGEFLGDASYAELKKQEISQRLKLDFSNGTVEYRAWKGLDRTQRQSQNARVVFAQKIGTIDQMTHTADSSNMRNRVIAVYTDPTTGEPAFMTIDIRGETTAVNPVIIDPATGASTTINVTPRHALLAPLRVLYVDTGMSIGEEQSEADFLGSVETYARTQLYEHADVINVDIEPIQNRLFYLTDYDLGDKCDIRDDNLGLGYEARIIEVNEVWKEKQHTVRLQFGDKIPVR